jgi:predicted amidohydrolase YtcJ
MQSQATLHGYGITGVTDAAANRGALEAFKALDDAGDLKLYVDFVIMMNDYMGDVIEPWKILEDRMQFKTRLLNPNKAKWGADGVPIASTSLMLEPYANDPDSHGQMTAPDDELAKFGRAMAMGAQLMVHSVGDGTARKVLDAIEQARKENPDNDLPVQLAHAVFVHPDDIARMKELNVIAEISPPMYFWGSVTTATIPALGQERISRAHPVREMLDAGLLVTYGSDWPASAPTANPWPNLEAMITRLNPNGDFAEYGALGEGIDLETALRIFTLNGATAMGTDELTGSIEVGKYADMIVLDANPFDLMEDEAADKIGDMNVTRTLFEGEVVFEGLR